MPSTIYWRGDAVAIAQVDTLTVGGTVEADDLFKMTINGKTLTVVAGSTSAATVAASLVAAWNLLTQAQSPEFYEVVAAVTSGGAFTLTAKTAGLPFVVTVATTEANGDAADDQTFGVAHTVVSSGPNDASTLANYSGAALPVDGDTLILENTNSSLLYGLDALAAVTLASLVIKQSFTGLVGLPRVHGSGTGMYQEYRVQYFAVGSTLWSLGLGDGSGSGRIKLNFGTVQYTGTIFNSGTSTENNIPAVLIKGTHASNALSILKGSVGVAIFASELSTISVLKIAYVSSIQSDVVLVLGVGVTVTTITKTGGSLTAQAGLAAAITTLTQYDGTCTLGGAIAVTTATIGGTLIDQSSGTITTLTLLPKGVYDHSKSLVAKTITTHTITTGCKHLDPYGVVTRTNGIVLSQCKPAEVTIDLPIGSTLAF
jgi:hypothetical protein